MRFKSKKILPKALLLAGFLVLALAIRYQNNIKELWSFNIEKLNIYFYNTFYQSNSEPKRKPSLSLINKEAELKLYIGVPFTGFDEADWQKFWDIIYEAYPLASPEREGLPNKVRQLTEGEIKDRLASKYPTPFGYFKDNHWQTFFSIIQKR